MGRLMPLPHDNTKYNRITIEMQINQVMQWMVEGMTRRQIIPEAEKVWGCKSRKVDDLIAAARKKFVEQAENLDRKEIVAEAIERYHHLYQAGLGQRQLAVSIAAQQALMKMIGADGPPK